MAYIFVKHHNEERFDNENSWGDIEWRLDEIELTLVQLVVKWYLQRRKRYPELPRMSRLSPIYYLRCLLSEDPGGLMHFVREAWKEGEKTSASTCIPNIGVALHMDKGPTCHDYSAIDWNYVRLISDE